MDWTVDDYNVSIKRGFVRDDGKVLWGKNPRLKGGLEWRTREAYDKNVIQKRITKHYRYKKTKAWLENIKLNRGCELCGFSPEKFPKKYHTHIAMMLEFDHVDPATKLYNVCDMKHYSREMITAEIDKCRVLCKPCHAEHTGDQNRKDNDDD